MTKREKVLGAAIGVLVLLMIVGFGVKKLTDTLDRRRNEVANLQKQIRDKRRIVQFSSIEADRLRVYERRSLPADVEKARALYQTWLLDTVTQVGLDDPKVNVVTSRGDNGVYHLMAFTVSGSGDLPRLVEFLHKFYSADFLHRIRRLHAKRVADSKRIDLAFSIEAISLPTSSNMDSLSPLESDRLGRGDLAAYLETILERNISGRKNITPRFDSLRDQNVTRGSSVEVTVSANDPDAVDRVTYSLEGDIPSGVILDEQSGRFRWRPDEVGEYEFVVVATDDGIPARAVRDSFTVNVREPDPPPPQPTPPPRRPNFDNAQFAFVTAITQSGGDREIWISLRTEGKMLKLKEGDQFKIGDVNVVVHRIDEEEVEIEAKELAQRLIVSLGQNLADGEVYSLSEL